MLYASGRLISACGLVLPVFGRAASLPPPSRLSSTVYRWYDGSMSSVSLPQLLALDSLPSVVRGTRVRRAFLVAEDAYGSVQHWTGVPLLHHVVHVLRVLLPFTPDEDMVTACLLHHVPTMQGWTLRRIEGEFGRDVKSMVRAIHLLSHVTLRNRRMPVENLRLMLVRASEDMRAILTILCDRCAVLETPTVLPPEERRRVCLDILQLFAPAAARLGIYRLKHILESRAFPIMYPVDAGRIQEQLQDLQVRYGSFLSSAAGALRALLLEHGIAAEVEGREKQPYSIFLKMRTKGVSHVGDLYDVFALRVVVANADECYRALGYFHHNGYPVPNRFKDYIAFPKPNGYRSVHTTLTKLPGVPEGVFVEVQIRTAAMHQEAELGIAAHWSYKEGGAAERIALRARQLLALDSGDGGALRDHIFVLTPHGDVMELPEGATPLDFAFHVHSDLGLSFRSARVNGSIAPLTHILENGDVVEILRSREPRPSPRWLELLRTADARSKLRRYLVEKGRVPFDKARLLAAVASKNPLPSGGGLRAKRMGKASSVSRSPVLIHGGVDFPLSYARCCSPDDHRERGDGIAGVITRLGRLKIHRQGCRMLANVHPDRRIDVQWDAAVSGTRA